MSRSNANRPRTDADGPRDSRPRRRYVWTILVTGFVASSVGALAALALRQLLARSSPPFGDGAAAPATAAMHRPEYEGLTNW